ncbi:MAG: PEP-CTERM sorting domain-containing protein [bacterium]|nr:PEP-CTERM sorting domain-containing protein [bacterium]
MFSYRSMIVVAVLMVFATGAQADLIFTVSPAVDGGVELFATGTSTGTIDNGIPDNSAWLYFFGDNVLAPADNSIGADLVSGSITVGPDTVDAITMNFNTWGSGDGIGMALSDGVLSGTVTAHDLTATWDVGTLPFADLTPGSYPGVTEGSVLNIVPEPGALALLALGGLAMIRRRR